MKHNILLFLSAAVLFAACSLDDDFKGTIKNTEDKPEFDVTKPLGLKQKQLYDRYGTIVMAQFPESVFSFDWSVTKINSGPNEGGFRYTPAYEANALEVLDSLDRWVFKKFSDEFLKKNLSRKIILVDTCCNRYTLGSNIAYRWWVGDIATNWLMYANVSPRFNAVKGSRDHVMSTMSLFVERMVSSGNLKVPAAFSKISADGYALASFSSSLDVVKTYSILKKGRKGQNSYFGFGWFSTTVAQDFGDFVAFTVYMPESEKQSYYAKNIGVEQKVGILKAYFKNELGFELPYTPRNP